MLLLCGRGDPDHGGLREGDPTSGPPPRGRGGVHPRDPPLPPEEQAARRTSRHRAAGLRAPAAAHRPGRAGARLHLVLGLRHRGDADPAGALRRPGRLRPGRSHHHRHPGRPLLRHPLVPGGHSALHEGRRLLRRGPRQLRSAHRSDRGRGAVDRLHGDGRRADVGRHRRADQCRAQPGQVHRRDHRGRDPAPALRQPARHPRGRELLRHPDLLLHLLVGERDCHRVRQGGSRHPALHPPAPGERGVRREDRHTR